MFGPLGFPELVFILVLALLIFGPKKLPEIGRTLGKGLAEFRRATDDLKRSLNTEIALEEEKPRRPQPQLALSADETAALHGVVPAAGKVLAGAAAVDATTGAAATEGSGGSPAAGETASPAPADASSDAAEAKGADAAAGAPAEDGEAASAPSEAGGETPAEAAAAGDAAAS